MKIKNNKICIISLENINRIPYINIYKENLKNGFDIIYWNRTGMEEKCGADNYYQYISKVNNKNKLYTFFSKLKGYIGFKKYVKKILSKNNYLGLVCMQNNCCVLVYDVIKKEYNKKYIMEIRDYWKEKNKIFYKKEKKAIEDSYFSVISSKAYKAFLPKYEYVISHNYPYIENEELKIVRARKKDKKEKIVLSCIGGIKYAKYDKEILKKFKNDERFEVRYIGRGYEILEEFVKNNEINNARIEGIFPKEKTKFYYRDTDIILNLYGNNTPNLDYALSNKLYYSVLYHIPIIVCPYTYMATIVEKYNIGFVFDKDLPNSLDLLYKYYVNLNWKEYEKKCEYFLQIVTEELNYYKNKIVEFENLMINFKNN